jgi:hypothetical protein
MRAGRRRPSTIVVALLACAGLAWPTGAGAQGAPPTVRLVASGGQVTLYRSEGQVPLDLGVWVAAAGGDFELRATRADYDSPIALRQTDAATGDVLRDLSAVTLEGWSGIPRFIRVVARNQAGLIVRRRSFDFCPNASTWDRQRVDDSGPALSRYPTSCTWYSPFTRGMVWGIDAGWATNALGGSDFGFPTWRLPDGAYTVTVRITAPYRTMLEIPAAESEVSVPVTVQPAPPGYYGAARTQSTTANSGQDLGVPDVEDPDPSTVPDLVALPLWGMTTFNRRGRDYLSFAATPWNAGPAPLVVEGFRRPDEEVMDAFQYFRDANGNVVGRAPVGEMRFHPNPRHNHWHFLQFAKFTLHDAANMNVVRSRKQAFCLAPTDAIDLTVERASWLPWNEIFTSCGLRTSLWVREVLHTGWGDTYYQWLPGQSFGITNLPNGWYYATIELNPLGRLYEVTTANNVESRLVYLGGRPGARWVLSSPWHGIEP